MQEAEIAQCRRFVLIGRGRTDASFLAVAGR